MKVIELWQFTHCSKVKQNRIRTRYLLTEADALARLKDPERVPGSRELRKVPESVDEWAYTSPDGKGAGGGKNGPGYPPNAKKPANPGGLAG